MHIRNPIVLVYGWGVSIHMFMETLSLLGDYFLLSVSFIDDHKDVWVASSLLLLNKDLPIKSCCFFYKW